ncbi:MAG: hypothetical protein JWP25_317 [Bradyrhizobium sp.]|nr:hypothetical protein [Bradyrhizobium sp.]
MARVTKYTVTVLDTNDADTNFDLIRYGSGFHAVNKNVVPDRNSGGLRRCSEAQQGL